MVCWLCVLTNKGVLTEWFYTKLLQHIGMNNYKSKPITWKWKSIQLSKHGVDLYLKYNSISQFGIF